MGLTAPLGAATAPGLTVLLGVLVGAVAAALVDGLRHDMPVALPHPAVVATVAALLPASAAGWSLLGLGAAGVLAGTLVPVLVLATAAVGARDATPVAPTVPSNEVTTPPSSDDRALDALLRCLPTDMLCDEWQRTATSAEPSKGDSSAGLRLRRLLIAEFGRRDREGTTRWLSEAPDARPDRYVRDARDRTT
jgi:hypothetical protein